HWTNRCSSPFISVTTSPDQAREYAELQNELGHNDVAIAKIDVNRYFLSRADASGWFCTIFLPMLFVLGGLIDYLVFLLVLTTSRGWEWALASRSVHDWVDCFSFD